VCINTLGVQPKGDMGQSLLLKLHVYKLHVQPSNHESSIMVIDSWNRQSWYSYISYWRT